MSRDEHRAAPEHRLERLAFFSDAVFAIAITLLVIELHAPHLRANAPERDYGAALAALIPSFMGFVISFFVVGAFWGGHHRVFALARRWSDALVLPNLLLLFTIAAMPFVTAFMSANPTGRTPTLVYAGWLLLASLFNIRLQRLVTAAPVVDANAAPALIALYRRRGMSVALASLSAIAAAAVLPYPTMGLIALTTIPLWRSLITRLARRRQG